MIKNVLFEKLTKQEEKILKLIHLGLTSKEIATVLYIGEGTVKSHRTALKAKSNIKNLVHLSYHYFEEIPEHRPQELVTDYG